MSTTATTTPETTIEADPAVPTIRIVRDFDAPPDRVSEPGPIRSWSSAGSARTAPR